MATGESINYDLPYPMAEDAVNIHGDIKQLVEKLEAVLPLASYSQIRVLNNSGATIAAGTPVHATGYTTATTIQKSLPTTTVPVLGLTKTSIANGANGIVVVSGILENINTSAFSVGDILYSADSGVLTNVRPEVGGPAVGIVAYAATSGIIIVEAKGNGTWGALKAGLA